MFDNIYILNLDIGYYCSNIKNIPENIRISERYKQISGNINDNNLLRFIYENFNITKIIHFAAQSFVDNSFENSIMFTEDNIHGTHNLLEATRLYCTTLDLFIYISTDEVYGDENEISHENTMLMPTNPYAASKAAAEMIVFSYMKSYNMPLIITRSNNIYGKNQYREKVIPKFIHMLSSNKKLTQHGNGSVTRNFLHVDDLCEALIIIIKKGKLHETYNIGIKNEISVRELSNLLIGYIKKTEKYDDWIEYIEDRKYNDKRYNISSEKINKLG